MTIVPKTWMVVRTGNYPETKQGKIAMIARLTNRDGRGMAIPALGS